MNLLPEILNIKEVIKQLLFKYPHLRDNDCKLIANVWLIQVKSLGYNPQSGSYYDAFGLIAKGKLSNSETIRRTRQKIQEEIVELRGASYMKRKITGETVRKNINAA